MRRHDLLRVSPAAWEAMLDCHPGLGALPLVAGWAQQDWPVIVRRRMTGDAPDDVPAGLPLPPAHDKRRVALRFPAGADLVAMPPVRLDDAARTAPEAWRPVIGRLVELGDAVGTPPCVFGALLWQHLTGLAYLTARSDLDLLWPAAGQASVEALIAGLRRIDADGPVRLDGEVVLPDGAAVNWRELAESRDGMVLLKTMDGVETRAIADLFSEVAR